MNNLVLSLFPGIGFLDDAFEKQGFCVVRGPDLLWDGNIKTFHPPPGKFGGVIGGPVCKGFSSLAHIVRARYGAEAVAENLIPEFERCVAEAQPAWFLMENVRAAPIPQVDGYAVDAILLNNRSFGSPQNRVRRFSFGVFGATAISLLPHIEVVALEDPRFEYAVVAGHTGGARSLKFAGTKKNGEPSLRRANTMARMNEALRRTVADNLELQGYPRDMLDHAPFTATGKKEVVGNGVPGPMGDAVAKAVKRVCENT